MSETGIFILPITVSKQHIDVNGHVNNVVYVQWMQDVAYAHSKSLGFDSERLAELGTTWVIRSHYIQYHRPAILGDELLIHTWPSSLKTASALRKYKFVRARDQATVVSGESDWVYIDRATGRPRAIEDEMREAFIEVPKDQEP